MKQNVGSTDKILRLLGALILVILYYFNVVSGTLGIVCLVIAAILVITALLKFCPIWSIFKIDTLFKKKE